MITTCLKTISEKQEITVVKASDGTTIKVVKDFKYLGSWKMNSGKDLNVRSSMVNSYKNEDYLEITTAY
jgi:hypothetical protein